MKEILIEPVGIETYKNGEVAFFVKILIEPVGIETTMFVKIERFIVDFNRTSWNWNRFLRFLEN